MPIARTARRTVARKRAPVARKRVARTPIYRAPYVRGRGAYYIKGSGSLNAKLPVGSVQAQASGGLASNEAVLRGMGAYSIQNIKKNSLITPMTPSIYNPKKENSVTIRHKEYIGTVVTDPVSGKFKIDRYILNPGNDRTFPFLHRIARSFESYSIDGCVIEYRSTSSDTNLSTLQLGSVYMSVNYDANDIPFINSSQIMNSSGACQSKISENNMYFLECDPRQRPTKLLYVRTDSDSNKTNDARLSDHGIFYIATEGVSGSSQNVGQLFISYQMSFHYPKLGDASGSDGGFFHVHQDAGVTAVAPLGLLNDVTYDELNNLPINLSGALNSVKFDLPLTNDRRTYIVEAISYMSVSSNAEAYQIGTLIGCTVIQIFDNETKTNIRIPSSAVASTRTYMKYFITTDANVPASFLLSCGVVGTTPTTDVFIEEVPFMDPANY